MTRPHILLIHCHDLGRQLGLYGADTVRSPRLDALGAQGITADRMFATAPQCSPSRASLFTGRWPHSNGVMGLTHMRFGWDLHPDEWHLARRLSGVGYRTELIGVHHESRTQDDELVATALGFDRVQTGGLANVVAERAVEALRRNKDADAPFYLQVGFIEPHRLPGARDPDGTMGFLGDHLAPDDSRGVTIPPYLRDSDSARAEIAELQGAIAFLDTAIGRVLDALDDLGLTEDTITMFTTDHGLALPRAKCSLYDPGVEVAFVVRWPNGGWTGGRRIAELLSNVDVVPTLLDALAVDADQAPPVQGHSFRPLLDGVDGAHGREVVFAEMTYHDYYDPRRCVRTDRYKLIANFSSAPAFMDPSQSWNRRCVSAAADHSWDGYHPPIELYDLRTDPLERTDLADRPDHADVRDDLLRQLSGWMNDTGDPLLDGAVTGPLHRSTLDLLRPDAPRRNHG